MTTFNRPYYVAINNKAFSNSEDCIKYENELLDAITGLVFMDSHRVPVDPLTHGKEITSIVVLDKEKAKRFFAYGYYFEWGRLVDGVDLKRGTVLTRYHLSGSLGRPSADFFVPEMKGDFAIESKA